MQDYQKIEALYLSKLAIVGEVSKIKIDFNEGLNELTDENLIELIRAIIQHKYAGSSSVRGNKKGVSIVIKNDNISKVSEFLDFVNNNLSTDDIRRNMGLQMFISEGRNPSDYGFLSHGGCQMDRNDTRILFQIPFNTNGFIEQDCTIGSKLLSIFQIISDLNERAEKVDSFSNILEQIQEQKRIEEERRQREEEDRLQKLEEARLKEERDAKTVEELLSQGYTQNEVDIAMKLKSIRERRKERDT